MNQIITTIIELVILVASFVVGKYIIPKLNTSDLANLTIIADWAKKFVTAAGAVLGDGATGEQKLEYVSKQLAAIAKEKGLNITDDQIRAIIEDAYATYKDALGEDKPASITNTPKADAPKAVAETPKTQEVSK